MSIERLKQNLNHALKAYVSLQLAQVKSAHEMHELDRTLRIKYLQSEKKLNDVEKRLLILERAGEEDKGKVLGNEKADIIQNRVEIRAEYEKKYRQPMLKQKAELHDATQTLQHAIDELRAAEGKEASTTIERDATKNEYARLAQETKKLRARAMSNRDKLDAIQVELSEALECEDELFSIKNAEEQPIDYQALKAELERIKAGEGLALEYSEETKQLAQKFDSLIADAKQLDTKLKDMNIIKQEHGLLGYLYFIVFLFIRYNQSKVRQATLKKQGKTAHIIKHFMDAEACMQERLQIRREEFDLHDQKNHAQEQIKKEVITLINLRRDFYAYCPDFGTLDESEQPTSGNIAVDKALADLSTFVTEVVPDAASSALLETHKWVESLTANPQETLTETSVQLGEAASGLLSKAGDAISGVWNRWRLHQPEQEKPEEEPLLKQQHAESIPESVQHVAVALRAFLGEPSTINFELLLYCMEKNATYAFEAPEGFKQLLNQTIDIYPELGERIIQMGHEPIAIHDRGLH